jgi:hypothetical protein
MRDLRPCGRRLLRLGEFTTSALLVQPHEVEGMTEFGGLVAVVPSRFRGATAQSDCIVAPQKAGLVEVSSVARGAYGYGIPCTTQREVQQ